MRTARKAEEIEEATEILEQYCADIASWVETTQANDVLVWDKTVSAMAARARAEAFRVLAGQALAEWYDWPKTTAEITSNKNVRMK